MAGENWLNGFILGQHAKAGEAQGSIEEWRAFAKQQAAVIRDLQDKLDYQTALATANRQTGQMVIEELRKLAPQSPLTDSDRIKEIGQQFFKDARNNPPSSR